MPSLWRKDAGSLSLLPALRQAVADAVGSGANWCANQRGDSGQSRCTRPRGPCPSARTSLAFHPGRCDADSGTEDRVGKPDATSDADNAPSDDNISAPDRNPGCNPGEGKHANPDARAQRSAEARAFIGDRGPGIALKDPAPIAAASPGAPGHRRSTRSPCTDPPTGG